MSRKANQDAVERWSKTVVRYQGVDRDCDFEVRRLGALPSYAVSQGLRRKFVPGESRRGTAGMDTYNTLTV
jgi:hypothetical protein